MNVTETTPITITPVPSYPYTVQWNFGKSQCSFETIEDLVEFVKSELPETEKRLRQPQP